MSEPGDDSLSERPPPRPSIPKRQWESRVISGRVVDRNPPGFAQGLFEGWRGPFAAGLAGAALGAALAWIGAWAFAPRVGPLVDQIGALEAARKGADAQSERLAADAAQRAQADAKLEARIGALEQRGDVADPLAARVVALEASAKDTAMRLQGQGERLDALAAARADAEARMASRIDTLEQGRDAAAREPKAEATARDFGAALAALREDLAASRQAVAAPFAEAKQAAQAFDTRLSALEGAAARPDGLAPLAAEARAARETAARALAATAAADPEIARLADAQAGWAKKLNGEIARLDALQARLDRFDAAAPKTESRIDAEPAPAAPRETARAVAALALREAFAAGRPLGVEIDALARLGEDEAALAPLRVYAEAGAPSAARLADELAAFAPATRPAAGADDVTQRLLGEVQGLVKMRRIGDAPAVAGLDEAGRDLRAGDLAAALAAFDLAPVADQARARGWREGLAARLGAERAAEALVTRAVAGLGGR